MDIVSMRTSSTAASTIESTNRFDIIQRIKQQIMKKREFDRNLAIESVERKIKLTLLPMPRSGWTMAILIFDRHRASIVAVERRSLGASADRGAFCQWALRPFSLGPIKKPVSALAMDIYLF